MNRDKLQSKTHTGKDRCQERVYRSGYMASGQCERAATVDGVWCKQHSPEAVTAREQDAMIKWEHKNRQRRYEVWGQAFHAALARIASGEEDPQAIARDTLDKFNMR
jgi:hypothetical protein